MNRREESRNKINIYKNLSFYDWSLYLLEQYPELKFNGVNNKDLEKELKKCLEVENYELAARIRDLIKEYHASKAIWNQQQQNKFKKRSNKL